MNLRRLDGPNQCFRLYLSPRKEDTSTIEKRLILDPKHLSCLFLLIVYGQKYQIYKLKADVDYPTSVILKNVRYNLNFKPKINEDRISLDQTLVYTCSLKII